MGQEDPLEMERATHSSIVGKSHGQRGLAGYSPYVAKRVRHDFATKAAKTKATAGRLLLLPLLGLMVSSNLGDDSLWFKYVRDDYVPW